MTPAPDRSDPSTWIAAVRASQDRFAGVLGALDPAAAADPSYDTEWSIGQVASHLGSQAEIFGLWLDAGLSGAPLPGSEVFGPIWDRWNAKAAADQVSDGVAANEAFVRRLEGLDDAQRAAFQLPLFGTEVDLAGFVAMRLAEHAVHTWDIAVALDPAATVPADAVELLLDGLGRTAGRGGKAVEEGQTLHLRTTEPERRLVLVTGPEISLTAAPDAGEGEPAVETDLELPAESLVRLVYGRLDPQHAPADLADDPTVAMLRGVFPGF